MKAINNLSLNWLTFDEKRLQKASKARPHAVEWNEIEANKQAIIEKIDFFLKYQNYTDLVENKFYVFKVIYSINKKELAKSKRLDFTFGEGFEKISLVYQVGKTIIFSKNAASKELHFFYAIPKSEFEKIIVRLSRIKNELKKTNSELEWKDKRINVSTEGTFIKNLLLVKEFKKNRNSFVPNDNMLLKLLPLYSKEEFLILVSKINLDLETNFLKNNSVLNIFLNKEEFIKLNQHYPWIFQKLENNYSTLAIETDFVYQKNQVQNFEKSSTEIYPKIGVIDSGSNLPEVFQPFILENQDWTLTGGIHELNHGSIIDSLIIANDEMNPDSPDGLGNFEVSHYELLNKGDEKDQQATVDFQHLYNNLEKIISQNYRTIKVWSISFGAPKEPWTPEISPVGMLFDYLSNQYNVLFVISSGNTNTESNLNMSLCSPADSINALSVGSIIIDDKHQIKNWKASSSGTTLKAIKPEVSFFGGPVNYQGENIVGCSPTGIVMGFSGTSYSAPRIARMAAWLIDKNGYTPMQAKSFIIAMANQKETSENINSNFGWVKNLEQKNFISKEILLDDNSPYYLEIDLTGVEKVEISYSYFPILAPRLGDEYSSTDIEFNLVAFKKQIGWEKKIERDKKQKRTFSKKARKQQKIFFEDYADEDTLILEGKYSSSRKVIYDLNTAKNQEIIKSQEFNKFAFRIKRMDLFNINEQVGLKVGFTIVFKGQDLTIEKLLENNHWLTLMNTNINISINEN